jgi:hypothetical protein
VTEGFLKPANRQIVLSDTVPESLVERLLAHHAPSVDKWLDREKT